MPSSYTSFLQRLLRKNSSQISSLKQSAAPPRRTNAPVTHITPEMKALEHDPLHTCQICNEPHLQPRPDETIEVPSILPCAHIFGSLCISRWLEVSSYNRDCPTCRRSLRYRGCGCGVRAIPLEMTPGGFLHLSLPLPDPVTADEMPEKCPVCRCVEQAYYGQGGEMGEKLRMVRERMAAEERALEGLKALGTPDYFGGGVGMSRDFGLRAADSKGYWRGEMERLGAEMLRETRAW